MKTDSMQALINFLYRNPIARIKQFRRFGGYFNHRKIIAARKKMERASLELPPVASVSGGFPVYFLTGRNYLYQTLFCIHSLVSLTQAKFSFTLVDDGSFDDDLINRINAQLPGANVISSDLISQNIQNVIPSRRYPYLNHKRSVYPHIKKLTDIHTIPGNCWKLVLDSDMLFWRKPDEILEWLADPQYPLHMIDCSEAYGYTKALMEELAGQKIKPLINVGAIGLNSDTINWDELESWAEALEKKEATSYFLEQALTAMLIGEQQTVPLPADKYIVNPDKMTMEAQNGSLHHYVDLSKEGYFKFEWRKLLLKNVL